MCSKFPDPATDGTQSNFAILDFTRKIALIGGTGYTGEMKRNFLCIEFHITCEQKIPMHCSANGR
jgi:phosphoenolpyruvate carboxykinase (ATP)